MSWNPEGMTVGGMNEQIRELEKQCWSHRVNGVLVDGNLHFDTEKFAALVAAVEREKCADICEGHYDTKQAARAIRERGE